VLLFVLWVAMAGSPVMAQPDEGLDASLTQQMPVLLERYGVSGSVVAAIEDGEVAWARAYGLADVSDGTPMGPDMVFNFGSCSKMITAWAAMRLVEAGEVDLDAPVNGYLRRWQVESASYDAAEVTVARLLSHTSGMGVHGYLSAARPRSAPGCTASCTTSPSTTSAGRAMSCSRPRWRTSGGTTPTRSTPPR
jgi:CubicO group peptidase (beta-lactamase class C family)